MGEAHKHGGEKEREESVTMRFDCTNSGTVCGTVSRTLAIRLHVLDTTHSHLLFCSHTRVKRYFAYIGTK